MMCGWVLFVFLISSISAQNVGVLREELHLPLTTYSCSSPGICQPEPNSVVIDANRRWTHTVSGTTSCFIGSNWDPALCPDPDSCTANCVIDGYDATSWSNVGVATSGDTVSLRYVTMTTTGGKSVGSRIYLLDPSGERYRMFYLLNRELSFDVDLSELECGMNGSLYFSEMDEDGGKSRFPTNQAGAKYGTGYCDAQCTHVVKWINGKANSRDWDVYKGHFGSCCSELDILEANSYAHQMTSHPCTTIGQTQCEGIDCGDNGDRHNGLCDKDGCEFNPWKDGNQTFFGRGPSFVIDTTQPLSIITQFITSDGTDDGDLVEIRRFYRQNGRVYQNPEVNFPGVAEHDSLTDDFCSDIKDLFQTVNDHQDKGGLKQMGEAMRRGLVLVMSLWDDSGSHMLWLDSNYPVNVDPAKPGISRGPCPVDSGVPSQMQDSYPNATVRFGNIRFGPIGSTYQLFQ